MMSKTPPVEATQTMTVDDARRARVQGTREMIEWLAANGVTADYTVRIDRETCDGTFLRITQQARDADGRIVIDRALNKAVVAAPFTVVERVPPPENILAAFRRRDALEVG